MDPAPSSMTRFLCALRYVMNTAHLLSDPDVDGFAEFIHMGRAVPQ